MDLGLEGIPFANLCGALHIALISIRNVVDTD